MTNECEREWSTGVVCEPVDELSSTAWHEAGHAVVYAVLDLPFVAVTIVPAQGTAGRVIVDQAMRPEWKLQLAAAAGPLAQEWYLVDQGWCGDCVGGDVIFNGCAEDLRRADGVDAAGVLVPLRPAVEAVAAELRRRLTLSAADVRRLVDARPVACSGPPS